MVDRKSLGDGILLNLILLTGCINDEFEGVKASTLSPEIKESILRIIDSIKLIEAEAKKIKIASKLKDS